MRKLKYISVGVGILFALSLLTVMLKNNENLVSLPKHHHLPSQARMSRNDHWVDSLPPTENMLVRYNK